jgi:predicted RNase H-like HicB family nuclease
MEYTVVLTKKPNSLWRAHVPALPVCEVEAATREEALDQIKDMIVQCHIEVIKIEVPEVEAPFHQNGHPGKLENDPVLKWAGAFRDDPTWNEMFDEIERQRDAHRVGG